jgi:hypothetical protein
MAPSDATAEDDVTFAEDAIPRGLVLALVLASVVLTIALSFIAYAELAARRRQLRPGGLAAEPALGPPRRHAGLEASAFRSPRRAADLADAQRARLAGYGWVDRAHGVVHIPIERAIELVAASAGADGASR